MPAAVVADTIVRTVELGVTITDAAVDGETTVVFCTLIDDGNKECPGCGTSGVYRDTVIRRVTDVPVVGHPLRLHVRVPRYRCVSAGCEREVFAHNTDRLAPPWLVHHSSLCPLHLPPADYRPRHRRRGSPGTGLVLGHRQHHRHGRHPGDRGHRYHPPGRWYG